MTAQRSPSLATGVARVDTVADLRRAVGVWRADGHRVGLVPTMGALHAGHLALVEEARRRCPRVVVSVFVNPAQFAPGEDFDEYPRDEAGDMAKLAALGVDLVFAPGRDEIYPAGFATTVTVAGAGDGLCAATRPHFFAGVATVVTKLLVQCLPDVAVFGEKDYQQLVVVRRLARDLDIPVEIVGVPTVREADGLAMSSRNAYLTPDERRIAGGLNVLLADVAGRVARGEAASGALAWGRQRLEGMGFDSIDYLELRDAETLEPVARAIRPARVLAAVCIGGARLIDNRPVAPVVEAAG
ncbi:MAG: pantoate--beta-alanine ligase [Proteobacteria bacterium]|nr:pantoate--beta-alanine ligase [Pseudomonadota bacterium]